MAEGAIWHIRSELQSLITDFARKPEPLNGLVVGPPGSGKTTAVRQATKNASIPLLEISSSILAAQDPVEIEAKVTAIFTKAIKSPCVIFFDDIDYWLPKSLDSPKDFHLLAVLVDQLEQLREAPCTSVAFIASALRRSEINPSLNAFTHSYEYPLRVVHVQPLSEEERRSILSENFATAHNHDDIESVVVKTPGYVAVDMARLFFEARRNCRARNDTQDVLLEDVIKGLPKVQPLLLGSENKQWRFLSAGSDVDVPLFGLDETLESIRQCLHSVFSQRDVSPGEASARQALSALGYCRGIVLHGASGTGKSALMRRAVSMIPQGTVNVMRIDSTDVVSSVIGEAERLVVQLFAAARAAAPTLLLIENIHILAPKRSDVETSSRSDGGSASKAFERLLSTFLVEMDGIRQATSQKKEILLLATTTSLDHVDPAMLRPGRFELHLETRLPNEEEIQHVLRHVVSSTIPHYANEEVLKNSQLMERLTVAMTGWSVAEVFALIRGVMFLVLRDCPVNSTEEVWRKTLTSSRITLELEAYLARGLLSKADVQASKTRNP